MKKILKKIEAIKGVVKVKNVGYNMTVVTCQPNNEPIIITEDGIPLFNKKDPCWWVNIDSLEKGKQKVVTTTLNDDDYFKYFSTKAAAKEFISMQEAVSDLQDRIAMDLVPASAYTPTATTAKTTLEAIKCDTKEQWDFMALKYLGRIFNYTFEKSNYDCVNLETDGSGACTCSENYYKTNGYTITPFDTFIYRESTHTKFEQHLLAEAEKRYSHLPAIIGLVTGEVRPLLIGHFKFADGDILNAANQFIYMNGRWAEIVKIPTV